MSAGPASSTDDIFEAFASARPRGVKEGIVEGVKLVGTKSRNRRNYPVDVLRRAIPLYEGIAIHVDHPKKPGDARRYDERLGYAKNVQATEDGLFGDVHFNPKHPCAERFAWDASNATPGVGFSHDAAVRFGSDGVTVSEIVSVRSVDLVSGPGTTKNLFESESPMEVAPVVTPAVSPEQGVSDGFRAAILKVLDDKGLDLKAKLKKIGEIMKAEAKLAGIIDNNGNGVPDNEEGAATEQLRSELAGVKTLLEQYQAKDAAAKRRADVEAECKAAGLDPSNSVHVSEQFSAQLMGIEKPEQRKPLIDDRASLVKLAGNSTGRSQVKPVTSGGGSSNVSEQYDPVAGARLLISRR